VSCAAAIATLDVLADGQLYERCRVLGDRFRRELRVVAARRTGVRDVRGVGLMIGVELASGAMATAVQDGCLDDGMIVLTCGPASSVLRLIPPLTLTDAEAELALDILGRALVAHG
jgi:4-aminobutyrate aminotransferase